MKVLSSDFIFERASAAAGVERGTSFYLSEIVFQKLLSTKKVFIRHSSEISLFSIRTGLKSSNFTLYIKSHIFLIYCFLTSHYLPGCITIFNCAVEPWTILVCTARVCIYVGLLQHYKCILSPFTFYCKNIIYDTYKNMY